MTFSSIISIETPALEKAGNPCFFREAESVECRKRDGRSEEDKLEMLCDLHREESSSATYVSGSSRRKGVWVWKKVVP